MSAPYIVVSHHPVTHESAGWKIAQFCLDEANREHELLMRANRFMLIVAPLLIVAAGLGYYLGYLVGLRGH